MLDIVLQRVASFRIDPLSIRRPGRRLAIVTSTSKHDYLTANGALVAFDEVVVVPDDEFDEASVTDAVRTLMGDLPTHQVSLLCHDEYALLIAARARAALGLEGPTEAQLRPFTDKALMKECLAAAGVRIPRFEVFDRDRFRSGRDEYLDHLVGRLGMPAFVKPTGESGAVGAARVDTREELEDWAEHVCRRDATGNTTEFEVDEFVTGRLFHVDTMCREGEVVQVRCNAYLHPLADYAAGLVCSSYTLDEDDEVYQRLVDFNAAVLDAFPDKPASGAFHHEVFETADGELVFLEIAARAPAALAPHTGRLRWGVDIEEAHFRLLQGEPVSVPEGRGSYAGFIYYPRADGRVEEVVPPVAASSSLLWMPAVAPGDELQASVDVRDFAGAVVLWNSVHDDLVADLNRLAEQHPVRVRPLISRTA